MRERNLVPIRVGAIDVVKADCDLRHNLQPVLPCVEDLSVDRIAQRSNQSIDSGLHFLNNQTLRRRLRLRIYLDFVSALAQHLDRFSNVTGSKHTEFLAHRWERFSQKFLQWAPDMILDR